MRSVWRFTLLVAALAVPATSLRGQTGQDFSIQGSALFVTAGGDAFAGTKAGPGVELQVRRNISEFSIGVGFQYSRHDFEGISDPMNLIGGFVEPRRVFPGSSESWAPYLSGRLAIFQQSISSQGVGASAVGAQINAGGGALFRITRNTNLDVGATFGLLRFGELTVNLPGGSSTYPSSSGTNFVLRLGLAVGLGS